MLAARLPHPGTARAELRTAECAAPPSRRKAAQVILEKLRGLFFPFGSSSCCLRVALCRKENMQQNLNDSHYFSRFGKSGPVNWELRFAPVGRGGQLVGRDELRGRDGQSLPAQVLPQYCKVCQVYCETGGQYAHVSMCVLSCMVTSDVVGIVCLPVLGPVHVSCA